MTENVVTLAESRKKAEGLVEMQNQAAELLEKHLGISFGDTIPRVLVFNVSNCMRIIQREDSVGWEGCAGKLGITLSFLIGTNKVSGFYNPGYDAIFYTKNKLANLSETDFHENLHGWQKRVNHNLLNAKKGILDLLKKSNLEKSPPEGYREKVSKLFANLIIGEGVAEWGAINISLEILKGESWNDVLRRKAFFLTGDNKNVDMIPTDPSTKMLMLTKDMIQDYQNRIINKIKNPNLQTFTEGISLLSKGSIIEGVVGFYYVDKIMKDKKAKTPEQIGNVLRELTLQQYTVEEILSNLV